ncbi:hypothetical protein DSL99_1228 [Leeuwenhoekiella marinoflava]|uniref:Uncharacterized protein n=1 Tax=Leeuwenhoekiella marinoflava TaxID=988 RepID=A0A4Q0PMZ6_9FLAO|nr:hypothetical protein DSL99_1228 [Leeuwenhoekiella marinoflava]
MTTKELDQLDDQQALGRIAQTDPEVRLVAQEVLEALD